MVQTIVRLWSDPNSDHCPNYKQAMIGPSSDHGPDYKDCDQTFQTELTSDQPEPRPLSRL